MQSAVVRAAARPARCCAPACVRLAPAHAEPPSRRTLLAGTSLAGALLMAGDGLAVQGLTPGRVPGTSPDPDLEGFQVRPRVPQAARKRAGCSPRCKPEVDIAPVPLRCTSAPQASRAAMAW